MIWFFESAEGDSVTKVEKLVSRCYYKMRAKG